MSTIKNIQSVATNAPAVADPLVTKLNGYLGAYKTALTGRVVSTASAKKAATALATATAMILKTPQKNLWDTFLAFHRENVDGVCRETVALQGLNTVTDKKLRGQISYLYLVFRNIVQSHRIPLREDDFISNLPVPKLWIWYSRIISVQN